jgi:hypothetical protein
MQRKKTLTIDCNTCDLVRVNDKSQFICLWGKSEKGKIMEPAKRKKGVLRCKLKK